VHSTRGMDSDTAHIVQGFVGVRRCSRPGRPDSQCPRWASDFEEDMSMGGSSGMWQGMVAGFVVRADSCMGTEE
jgi:hypothetical protein